VKILYFSFFISFFFQLNFYAQSGWSWQNPYPQGNTLHSISFLGALAYNGWAVGPLGTAIHTTNGGINWEIVDLGTIETLNCVYMHSDNQIFIVGDNGVIFSLYDDGGTIEVTPQTSNTTEDLRSITSNINNCPWIAGDNGTVLRTTDMGVTWTEQNVIYSYDLYSLHNVECTRAWAVGLDGFIMHTSDWGISWHYQATPTNSHLLSVEIGTFDFIRAVGNSGTMLLSTDLGETWVAEDPGTNANLRDVLNIGYARGYAVGWDGVIIETTDVGEPWIQRNSNTTTTLYDVEDVYNSDDIWVVGHYGVILKNSGIGTDFEIQNEGTLFWIKSVEFLDENTGWAVGGDPYWDGNVKGVFLRTTDGGTTWIESPSLTSLNAVDFINETDGWAVGRGGTIVNTTNGGLNWTSQTSGTDELLTSIYLIDQNYGWAVGTYGKIIHTTNGGLNWMNQTSPTQNDLYGVYFVNATTGWAVGLDSTIIHTTDGGQNWIRQITNASNGFRFTDVQFIDELHGWVVGIYGSIFLTTDGSATWQEIESGTPVILNSVHFIDHNNGWAAGGSGTILRTRNGGFNWTPQFSGIASNTLSSICFVDALNGWAVGDGGTIINTVNGGGSTSTGAFWRNDLNKDINDLMVTEDVMVVDVSGEIPQSYELVAVEVIIDTVFHTADGDLEFTISHAGVTDTIIYQVGGDGDNFIGTTLSDAANLNLGEGTAPFTDEFKPYNPLSAFSGVDPNGEWTLEIYDGAAGNTGVLQSWGLKLYFESPTDVNSDYSILPNDFEVYQNFPNPFNPSTTIRWQMPETGFVTLKIYDVLGREIITLVNEELNAGKHETVFDASRFSSGIYFYQLRAGEFIQTKKMILIK
jgi:photosystem II stability/assembly factor-like uncharacterized protein